MKYQKGFAIPLLCLLISGHTVWTCHVCGNVALASHTPMGYKRTRFCHRDHLPCQLQITNCCNIV